MRLALALLALPALLLALYVLFSATLNALDRGEPVRLTRAGLSRAAREWAYHVLTVLLLPTGLFNPGPTLRYDGRADRVPTLLIPGYGMNRGCMRVLSVYLHARGWRYAWPVNNGPSSGRIPERAQRFAESVARLQRESGAARVDVVAHSMGGVIAAWYIQQLGGAAHVRRLVTLGTPWQGTKTHVFGLREVVRDMAPDSEILARIQPPSVPVTAIWSRADGVVHPATGSVPRSDPAVPVRVVEIPGAGHSDLIFGARALRAVQEALLAADPAADAEGVPA